MKIKSAGSLSILLCVLVALFAGCAPDKNTGINPGDGASLITADPENITVSGGQSAVFYVRTDKPDLLYQWQKDGRIIPGATESSYTIQSASLWDDGTEYRCLVSSHLITDTSKSATLTVTGGITMIPLLGGTFQMGSAFEVPVLGSTYETPAHSVTISAFRLSRTEITQAQYLAVIGTNPSMHSGGANSTLPVEQVSWFDAALFCNALSKLSGKDTVYQYSGRIESGVITDTGKNGYRLPTEAEWEYACRANTTTDFYWGKNIPVTTVTDTMIADSNIVWAGNSDQMIQPVGSKLPNALGLYDISGNVWEWCNDLYSKYVDGAQINPMGPVNGTGRVLRGGSYMEWDYNYLRSAYRGNTGCPPGYRPFNVGFRVACRP